MPPLSERNNSSRLSAMTSATGTSALEQLQQRLRDLQQQRQSLKNPEVAAKPRPASAQQISAKRVVPPGKPKTPGVLMPRTSGFTGSPIHHALPPSGMNAPASDSKLLSARPSTQGGARPSSKLGPRGSFGPACGAVPPLFATSSTPRLDLRPDSSAPLSTDRERTALVHRQRKLIREGYIRHGLPVPTITEATSLEPLLSARATRSPIPSLETPQPTPSTAALATIRSSALLATTTTRSIASRMPLWRQQKAASTVCWRM